ncbi:MAG: bacteriophage abortive infection AbiH family protein [Paludibacteraceae bacterium]|nr:bacteriophage abortive infection AbiH family protein [Paludibacteraceae bacterium]
MKTLYIIGNGFDLVHELPTRYQDFGEWLRQSKYTKASYFADTIDGLFVKKISLWRNFEEALGNIDVEEYIKSLKEDYIDTQDPENFGRQAESFYAGIEHINKEHYEDLIEAFRAWARSIETNGVEPIYGNLNNADNYFFTFNYTDTLEQVYGVDPKHVMHIHGDASDERSLIEVGHKHDYIDQEKLIEQLLDKFVPFDLGDSRDSLIEMLNLSIKHVDDIISRNGEYFNNLHRLGIDKIIVQGHGYGEIDWAYFEKIKDVCPNAQWELRWHTPYDLESANIINKRLTLSATTAQI